MNSKKRSVLAFLIGSTFMLSGLSPLKAQDQSHDVEIHAKRYSFAPAEVTIKKGETVTLHLISDDVPHSLVIPGLKINATMIKGHPSDVTVTPDSAGDFHGECGRFCGSGHGAMLFTVHVKD